MGGGSGGWAVFAPQVNINSLFIQMKQRARGWKSFRLSVICHIVCAASEPSPTLTLRRQRFLPLVTTIISHP